VGKDGGDPATPISAAARTFCFLLIMKGVNPAYSKKVRKQKDFSGKLNETIKTRLVNIIAIKTNYKNEIVKIQDIIKYDIINNNENNENKN
jgi:hypothetical protein